MNPFRLARIVSLACLIAVLAAAASAQTATTPPPEAKGQPAPQGFSVVLVLGDGQLATVAENVPQAARRALADMKDFLPYKGYRLLDAQWILGSPRSTSRLRGPDDQEYQLTLRTVPQAGRIHVTFHLQEPGSLVAVNADETAARRATVAELQARLDRQVTELAAMRQRLGDRHVAVTNANAEIESLKQRIAAVEAGQDIRPRTPLGGRSVIDTTFSMELGETVVVGTSRMRGGDKALIALLTAVPKATTKRE